MLKTSGKSLFNKMILVLLTVALLFTAVACRRNNEKPNSEYRGFYSSMQSYQEGKELTGLTLSSITTEGVTENTAKVILTFVNTADGSAARDVPAFNISMLTGIPRAVITFNVLDACTAPDQILNQSLLYQGVFSQKASSGTACSVYVQLSGNSAYKVEMKKNQLILEFKKEAVAGKSCFYALLDAFAEYREGELDDSSGFTPVLCSDVTRPVLISEAFDDQASAESFAENTRNIFTDRASAIRSLYTGEMPYMNEKPEAQGYYSAHQEYLGGALINNGNLSDITVTDAGDVTNITLQFVQGSVRIDGQEKTLNAVPEYSLECMRGISRMVIRFNHLAYWDFYNKSEWSNSAMVQGIFKQIPNENTPVFSLYIQLDSDPVYTVKEEGNKLIISVKKAAAQSSSAYYVVANAFMDYQNGQISAGHHFTPVLCSDQHTVVLVSSGYATKQEAETAMNGMTGEIAEEYLKVVQMSPGELPKAFSESGGGFKDVAVAQNADVRPIFAYARFLAMNPDGMNAVFAKPKNLEDESAGITEELWMMNLQSHESYQIGQVEFSSIVEAQFSPSATKLAIVEETDEYRILSVISLADQRIISLTDTELGLGMVTTGIAWGDTDDTLYAIAGEDVLQLKKIVLSSTPQVTVLETVTHSDSSLERVGCKLYYLDNENGMNKLKEYDLNTGTKNIICDAEEFKIAPNGQSVAVTGYSNADYDLISAIYCAPLTPNASRTAVSTTAAIENFFFGADQQLYYALYSDRGDYPLSVYSYDGATGASREVFSLVVSTICAGPDANSIMAFVTDYADNRLYAATYMLTYQ